MSKILIGWAEESFVPDKKVSLAGQFFERISEFVESDVCATAMAVEADGEQMIMVSVDMEGFPEELVALAREKFAKLTDEIDRVNKKLSNESFVAKATAAVVDAERAKLAKYMENLEGVKSALEKLN